VWIERDGRFVIGDGGLRLLLGIARTGSLTGAARDIGWSYRHAWGYLRRAARALGVPLAAARPGKGAQRGMVLTTAGDRLVAELGRIRDEIDALLGPTGPSADDIAGRWGMRR
jgi:molybdate transport system regulatory protein